MVKLLVGNKVDKERVVTRAQAEEYARSKGMLFLEARCVLPTPCSAFVPPDPPEQKMNEFVVQTLNTPDRQTTTYSRSSRPQVIVLVRGTRPDRASRRGLYVRCCCCGRLAFYDILFRTVVAHPGQVIIYLIYLQIDLLVPHFPL